MSVDTIRVVLGRLQDDPESETAWEQLAEIVTAPGEHPNAEAVRLLEQARSRHERRREWASVARLLEIEITLASGQPEEAAMQAELARIYDEELLAPEKAKLAYDRLLELETPEPMMEKASTYIENNEGLSAKWRDLYERYLSEAEQAADDALRAGLLLSAADIAHRYGANAIEREKLAELVEKAATLDPRTKRLAPVAEAILRDAPEQAVLALEAVLARGNNKDERVAAGLKAGRIRARRLNDKMKAIADYEQVLDLAPGQPDALSYLAEAYTETEQWDHLVALYEDQLKGGGVRGEAELGILLQIAMVHWRMRKAPESAEPYFERVRRADPAHAGMLSFFRELCEKKGDNAKLVTVLSDAQRATHDAALKKELAAEIARAAEAQDNAQKAIEQYKALLRADPNDASAHAALKRLYAQTENHAALVDLLKHEAERVVADAPEAKAAVLREVAGIYRDKLKNEQALVQVLSQITQLDANDEDALRELVRIYGNLGRFRDLLTCQQKLAEITKDDEERAELYRAVARRWAEQFSNVQNAITAYEGLIAVRPRDEEARSKLKELYSKRRAWAPLFALYETALADAEGAEKVELLSEMAKLAAERLDRGADAIRLQKQILDIDPTAVHVYDALEKQAEREKDYATVAEVLERRVDATSDAAQKLAILQKLGAVYSDRLKDNAGATKTWRRVLEISPGQAKALRVLREAYLASEDYDSLEQLYAAQNDWEGLAEFLSSSADKAHDREQKIGLSFRAAAVYEKQLTAPERATRSYERVLSVDVGNAQAAKALVPIYETEERWARLPALYEILLSVSDDDAERVTILRKLASVTSGPLPDRAAALGYARRAYDLIPDEENLELLEAASRAASSWAPFVEAIEARLATPKSKKKKDKSPGLDPKLERSLRLKLANAYARELGKIDEAVTAYRVLVEADPKDEETLREFDALLRASERKDDLRWLFELRVTSADESDRARIYEEWATLEEDVFANAEEATKLYRKAAELAPERGETLKSLARLLLGAGDHAGAVEVLLKHRDLSEGADRAQREVELAFEYADHLKQPELALEACLRALELRPRDPDAIAILARLVDAPETRFRAASELASAYADLGDSRREGQMLRVVIEGEEDEARRLELHKLLADVEEKKLGAPGAAFDVVLRALNESPGDLTLWDRAAELASKSGRPTDLAESYRAHVVTTDPESRRLTRDVELELCDRAATLHDEQLGDPDGALPYLKRILAMDPQDQRAFGRLKQILTQAERWGEIEELFDQAAQASEDPAQKIALLSEVAMLAEEVIQLPQKAIAYHERILEIDPHVATSLDTLEKLYEDEERFGDLAALLERRLELSDGDEAIDIRLYLGRLYLEQLLVPDRALSHVEAILSGRHEDADARELAERLLEIGSLRLRTAQLLESVYESRSEHRSLVRMLEIRLEAAPTPEERAELLRRIGELRDEKLHDDAGAFAALSELVPLVPEDEGVRERFVEIGRRLGQHERVTEVLSSAAEKAASSAVKAELYTQVAAVFENALGAPERAEEIYRKVLAIDPDDATISVPAARALARIQAEGGRHEALAESLEVEVKLEESADTRKGIYERLGDLYETVLQSPAKAIEAWRRRLADDDTDEKALVALERLYEKEGRFRDLVDVLRRREETAQNGDERKRAMSKAAEVLAGPLDDVPQATSAYRAVLDAFGADRAAHAALATLYEKAERYQDLAEIIDVDLAVADETGERVKLYNKLGDVRRLHLGELEGAIDAYRLALELDASDPSARAALEAMLEGEAKSGAAELLHPLYEADGAAQKLLRVLEIEAEVADSPAERIEKLEKALATAEGSLNDPAAAYDYARRAVKEAASDESIGRQMETLERLTAATDRFAETCDLYREVSSEVIDGDVQLSMLLRVGDIAKTRLEKSDLAIEYYKKALEARPDEKKAMLALEELYQRREDHQALLDVLRKRAEVADNDDERKELLFREADLLQGRLEDKPGAISVLEAVLEVDVDPRATSQLETLYASEGRFEDLVALYERMLEGGLRGSAAAALRVKIAKTARGKLSDSPRAFDELVEALSEDPGHDGAVQELEAILGQPKPDAEGTEPDEKVLEERARAAEMLEPIYLKQADWGKVKTTLEARLDASQDPGERGELLKRLSTLHEDQLGDYTAALDATARLLHEDIGDRGVWSELERLARVASAEKRLADIFAAELAKVESDDTDTAELCKKTGEIYADLGERTAALKWYRRAHVFAPDSEELFEAIDALLVKEALHQERVDLMRAALDYREGERRLTLLHTVADIEEAKLSRAEDAIETYRAALEVDERDTLSLDRLTELYRRLNRHRDLADLYERRADSSESAEAAAPYRLALAKVRREHLADTTGAIDQLEAIVADVPWNREAIAELESLSLEEAHKARVLEILRPLYQRADNWENLVKINEEGLALAHDRSEKAAILRENANLLEQRGGDKRGAFASLLRALAVDPDDGDVRSSLERLARELSAFNELADALESAASGVDDDITKRELLAMLARIYDEETNDPRRALVTFERLAQVSPGDPEPLTSIDELAVLLGDWTKVASVLEKKVEEVSDAEAAELLRRLARTRAEMLEDEPGAITAFEKALELEPDSAQTMDSLIALYEAKNAADRLVELYRQRVDASGPDDADLRYDLNIRSAKLHEGPLENRKEAIAALGAALDSRPGDLEVLRHLERLYRAEQMWDELLDNLQDQAARADSTADRANLRVSIGDLYKDKLDSPIDALEQYRLVLEEAPDHTAAAAAVMSIAETSADLRFDASEILLPVLKGAERHADRVKVLELKLLAQTEPDARAATLKEIADVNDQKLGKTAEAEDALLRALAETPEEGSLHDEIVRLAHLTRGEDGAGEGFKRYADALAERAAAVSDAAVARGLWIRLGRVAEENLKDDKRAADAFSKALDGAEGEESELTVLTSLDRLYERLDDAKALAEVIERRVAVEPESEQADLYCRLAKLQAGAFRDPNAALGSLRIAIEKNPSHVGATAELEKLTDDRTLFEEVAETLESVYRQNGDNKALGALFEKRIAFASGPSDRVKLRLDLARVLEDRASDPKAALGSLLAALEDDASDSDVLAEIERVATIVGGFGDAAEALEKATEKAADLPSETVSDLWIRAAMWRKDKMSDPAGAEKDFERALQHDQQNEVILRSIEEIQRAAGRERDLVSTLRRLAKIDGISGASELRREAFTIAEQRASDAALAEEILREVIAADEADAWALGELTRLRKQAGDGQETYKLLVRRTELAADGESIRALRHEAAAVARNDLKDLASAIDLYEQIFEDLPTDEQAQVALRALYEETGKKKELLKLLGCLVDVADEPSKRSTLRLEAARVSDELEAPSDAIEQLVAVLDEEPAHRDAALMLSRLYEKSGRDDELAELLEKQIGLAAGRGDLEGELSYRVRLGEVQEGRLGDLEKAAATYAAVLDKDGKHKGALVALARIQEKRGDKAESAKYTERLLELEQGDDAVATAKKLAALYESLSDVGGRRRSLERALAERERDEDVRSKLRSLYEQEKDWEKLAELHTGDAKAATEPLDRVRLLRAAADIYKSKLSNAATAADLLQQASEIAPSDRELLLALCDAYSESGRGKQAVEVLQKIVDSYGGRRSKEVAVIHHRLARAYLADGDRQKALAELDTAFKIDPGSISVLRDLGVLALELADADPDQKDAYVDRAGKTFKALLLQRLDEGAPITKAEVFFYLGEVSHRQGDDKKAIQMLERALDNDKGFGRAKELLAKLKG